VTEPVGIGAATEPPRWPAHVVEECDDIGVYVHCLGCYTVRYVCRGRMMAGDARRACWDFASVHQRCRR